MTILQLERYINSEVENLHVKLEDYLQKFEKSFMEKTAELIRVQVSAQFELSFKAMYARMDSLEANMLALQENVKTQSESCESQI